MLSSQESALQPRFWSAPKLLKSLSLVQNYGGIMRLLMKACVALAACLLPTAAIAADRDPMTRDLLLISDWFEGRFDNEEQRWFQGISNPEATEADKHARIHTIHKRVAMPDFGDHVFYVEEYKDHDPEAVIRQRLVIFSTNSSELKIRMQQGFFRDSSAVRGAHRDPSKLSAITAADVTFLDQCDVYWRRVASQFEGRMEPKACVFGEGADRRYSVHDLYLSPDKYWRVDSTFRVSDDSLFVGEPVDEPFELRRAKLFDCSVYFFANNQFEGQVVEGLEVHSQGGTVAATRESDGKTFEILMRDKEYPYYDTRPDFIYFSLREQGNPRSIAFATTDPKSRQIGVRAESIGAFCNRKGYQFREPLGTLQR